MNVCLSDEGSIQFVCLSASHLVVVLVYPSVGLSVSLSNCVSEKRFPTVNSGCNVYLKFEYSKKLGCDEVEGSQVSIFVKL